MSETRLTDVVETSEQKSRRGATFDPSLVGRAVSRRAHQALPAHPVPQPRHVRRRDRQRRSPRSTRSAPRQRGGKELGFFVSLALWLWFTVLFANFAEAMAEGRGKAQADALRTMTTDTTANRLAADGSVEVVRRLRPSPRRHGRGRGQRDHPGRRRRDRRHRLGRRVGDHRRVRPGHPRERRRPQRGHRRHQGALRPHRRAHHVGPRPDVPRPHDRAGRGREPAEDPQRDRARHPAHRAHDHLRAGGHDAEDASRSTRMGTSR